MAKKEKSFREILEEAKKKDLKASFVEVPVDEIQEGLTVKCYPLKSCELEEVRELWDHEDEAVKEWAVILVTYKDSDGARCFHVEDIDDLEAMGGFRLRNRLHHYAVQLSGLGEEFKALKKHN